MSLLVYLALGDSNCRDQAIFSMLSALRFRSPVEANRWKIVIYTDTRGDFDELADEIILLTPGDVSRWKGPLDHFFRLKLLALQDSIQRHKEPAVWIDADTFFKLPPESLFAMIAPGRTVMDQQEPIFPEEARVCLEAAMHCDPGLAEFFGGRMHTMWNSGVIGVHPADSELLAEAIELNDRLFALGRNWYTEQLATGLILDRKTQLGAADSVIYHYCHPALKSSFAKSFPRFMKRWRQGTLEDRVLACMAYRPRWGPIGTAKIVAKRVLKAIGVFRHPIRFDLT